MPTEPQKPTITSVIATTKILITANSHNHYVNSQLGTQNLQQR